jgi:hypothetical protein
MRLRAMCSRSNLTQRRNYTQRRNCTQRSFTLSYLGLIVKDAIDRHAVVAELFCNLRRAHALAQKPFDLSAVHGAVAALAGIDAVGFRLGDTFELTLPAKFVSN